jgi:hypothetical protein
VIKPGGSAPSAEVSRALAAQANSIPGATAWGACGATTSHQKVARTFDQRSKATGGGYTIPYGNTYLRCGDSDWGYRHVFDRHMQDWKNKAALVNNNWRDTADFGIAWALYDPDKTLYRASNDTFCYSRLIHLVNKKTGREVGHYYANVAVSRIYHNVITAYPKGKQCSGSLDS